MGQRPAHDHRLSDSCPKCCTCACRFFCDSAECGKQTFAARIPGLTIRYGQCTVPLRMVREAVAFALGGQAGARLAKHLSDGISREP
ncbi:hypothetical protein ABT187_37230 [Streptomyces sp. NPDC001817]|uniref:hypothetical protein n=1 Tax=Streptomyces sp. NPDC001817 TaxID=3154398 RepID=UPI00331FF326